MEDIIKEKTSADHLLYVSLKYTKTCDVIINLLLRWANLISLSIDKLLQYSKKKKKIKSIPTTPLQKEEAIRKLYKKNEIILETLDVYDMFKKIDHLSKTREGEFRKNVALRVEYKGKEIVINMDQLKEYSQLMDKFVEEVRQVISV